MSVHTTDDGVEVVISNVPPTDEMLRPPVPSLTGDVAALVSLLDALTLRGVVPRELSVGSARVELGANVRPVGQGSPVSQAAAPRSYLGRALAGAAGDRR